MTILPGLLQGADSTNLPLWVERIWTFIDTPAPYSPLGEYLLVLFMLWLLARRTQHRTFEREAQDILDEKYEKGEITKKAYDKYRQDISLRPKR